MTIAENTVHTYTLRRSIGQSVVVFWAFINPASTLRRPGADKLLKVCCVRSWKLSLGGVLHHHKILVTPNTPTAAAILNQHQDEIAGNERQRLQSDMLSLQLYN